MPRSAAPSASPQTTVRRTQFRVGHGGFHTTILKSGKESFVYIYDSGASPSKARVLAAIDSFVATLSSLGIATVDCVVLSHIDEDHVNGFTELIAALDAAHIAHPRVVLPWLEPAEKLLALAHANHRDDGAVAVTLAGGDGDVSGFLRDLGFDDIVFVLPADPAPGVDAPAGSRFVAAGTDLAQASPIPWVLIAARIRPNRRTLDDFRDRIIRHTGLDPDISRDREELVTKHRSYIRVAMRAAANSSSLTGYGHSLTNWSSLSVFGASPTPVLQHAMPCVTPVGDLTVDCDHAWLHTGDLPLDVPDVWSAIAAVWQSHLPSTQVCALAAPHHGSPNGHNPLLFSMFTPTSVMYMTGWTAGTAKAGRPLYAKKVNPSASKAAATRAGAVVIELNNP